MLDNKKIADKDLNNKEAAEMHRAIEATEKNQQYNERHSDSITKDRQFKIGNPIWAWLPEIKMGTSKKLSTNWKGPFQITEQLTPVPHARQ